MTRLSRSIIQAIVEEFGPEEFLRRLADPTWFQSFGCVLAFDWNSSGLTTTTCAALKSGLFGLENGLGVYVCGGKGKTSRKTPSQIEGWADRLSLSQEKARDLVYASKISAKVDSSAIQDGFQLYHHSFVFTKNGSWAVIQQGMNTGLKKARRYHWLSDNIKDFIEEPHSAICSDKKVRPLNLVAKESAKTKEVSTELVRDGYKTLMKDLKSIQRVQARQSNLFSKILDMPGDDIMPQLTDDINLNKSRYLDKILYQVHEQKPKNFEQLLMIKGVGPKTVRALSLVSEVIYGAKPSYEDPARYSFAFGGKDGIPYPVERHTYDKTLDIIEKGIKKSRIDNREKSSALRRFQNVFKV